ncbi:MAG: ABC transporter permease DevC [Pegethrix bostrychoides GSE-TBD4-15B]|jgi:putative ABC transport system permease protein|uniref:ABC transporter permease DevC n=1 Tax=Pegethrix bostrychoides GSE-TBD4-15B TaxID=2839662 RepID=A0A951U2R6_9CYAN|nr:ABC transporter permease DevC [Pegethrix bostrychoides GSE-TBD4-15B]
MVRFSQFVRRTPLAWFNLTYERRRLLTSLAGVAFSVLLMFIFRGFENALYDSQVQLLKLLNGDVVLISPLKNNMFVPEQIARQRLYQAQAYAGVEAAYPLYTTTAYWKNPETRRTRPLRVIAFNLSDPVLQLPGITESLRQLQMPWTALLDQRSRPEVGSGAAGTLTEVDEQQIKVVGSFELGTDFASGNGNVVMSDQNFLRYFGRLGPDEDSRDLSTIDLGLLKLAPDQAPDVLARTLSEALPKDVKVMTKAEFVEQELNYWRENTSIGFVFSLLAVMSFAVGIILVYQILYTDISDHWSEYATLKAMGYSNLYLLGVVIQEAVILAVMGFIPGCLVSAGLYKLTANATGLLMQMTQTRIINLFIATVLMCLISGAIAVRKVQTADPAEVFGL